mgnify:CR=1 FL=1
MGNAGYRRGAAKENRRARQLEADGWVCAVTRGSHGPFDILAVRAGRRPRLEQVKSTRTPFSSFPPREREQLLELGRRAGADVFLVWFPPRSNDPVVIPPEDWPKRKG